MRTLVRAVPLLITLLVVFLGTGVAYAHGDPGGADTLANDPTAAVNFTWILVAAFLVFFMQAGFALLGAGLVRAKNTVNYLTKSFMDFSMASLSYWAFGFALMFGGSGLVSGVADGNDFLGYSGFFLAGDAYDVSTSSLWLFQMVFVATAATIVAGAVAERMKITAYLAYSFIIAAFIYPIYGHWVWGGGWLSKLDLGVGAVDFAGSGVVHAVGGLVALAGAIVVGPRIGKFNADGKPNKIPGHNMVYVVLGTFILFFGWFGFNAGSTTLATELRISVIAVNTFLAGTTGAVVAIYYSLVRTGKADLLLACNGTLAGLVGITAPCAWVAPWAAVVIGGIAAMVMIGAANLIERKLKVDDVIGAVAVHGGAGLWGLLAVGLFADGTYGNYTTDAPFVTGLFYGGDGAEQLLAQLISMGVVTAWALGTGLVMFWIIKVTMGLRVSREEELQGLDVPEHGIEAYPAELPLPQGASE